VLLSVQRQPAAAVQRPPAACAAGTPLNPGKPAPAHPQSMQPGQAPGWCPALQISTRHKGAHRRHAWAGQSARRRPAAPHYTATACMCAAPHIRALRIAPASVYLHARSSRPPVS
jgi:hypothetical protein